MATNRPSDFVTCPRCDTALQYAGTKNFHEGTRFWDFMGGLFELLKNREGAAAAGPPLAVRTRENERAGVGVGAGVGRGGSRRLDAAPSPIG